jgi:Domain of unknown function (DUF4055)
MGWKMSAAPKADLRNSRTGIKIMTTTPQTPSSPSDNNKSDFKSRAWQAQAEAWKITGDLWQDSLFVRRAGREYLTQLKKEPNEKYDHRKANSVFISEFRGCIQTMSGVVFRSSPNPLEVEKRLSDLFPDIDMLGNSLHAFCVDAFERYLRDGNGFIHIDAPRFESKEGVQPSAKDRDNDRPFWKFYEAKQIINQHFTDVAGRQTLTQITIQMQCIEPDGDFGEKIVTKNLVLRPGSFIEYTKNTHNEDFVETGSGETGLDFIPIVNLGEFGASPPLITLALLNILHYNKTSDFDDWCHIACVPEKVYRYDTKADAEAAVTPAIASAGMARKIWGPNAEVTFTEVTGKGLEIAKDRYQDVEGQMNRIGVGMFAPTEVAPRSATEVADTAGQRQSKLAKYTRQFENAIEKALYMTGQIINSIVPNSVNLDTQEDSKLRLKIDYDRLTFSVDQMRFYSDLVDSGKMSLQTFLEFLMNTTELPKDFKVADELERIKKQNAILIEPGEEIKSPDDAA